MLQQTYSLLIHWKQDAQNLVQLIGAVNDGMAFADIGTEDMGHASSTSGGAARSGQQQSWCYNCNQFGHIMWDCPDQDNGSKVPTTQLLMQGIKELVTDDSYEFTQADDHLPKFWILLDTGSTVNIFSNKVF